MRKLLFVTILLFLSLVGKGYDIRINSEAKVVAFTGVSRDTAIVEFDISWDDSWRDDFNWDAAWIFLKYKKRGSTELWHHAYLAKEGHLATPIAGNEGGEYMFMFGDVGSGATSKVTGIYLMRDEISEGRVNARLRVKWPIKSNSNLVLSESNFGEGYTDIYLAAYAIRMVYMPYGSYYLGDDYSNGTFSYVPSTIPAAENLIGGAGYTYSASSIYSSSYQVTNALPGAGGYWCASAAGSEDWWQVDFKTPKTVRYFAAASAEAAPQYAYLEGSNDASSWTVLWTGGVGSIPNTNTYPIPLRIKIASPAPYRYYRIRMESVAHPYASLYNIAMSDVYVAAEDISSILIDNEDALSKGSLNLPAAYPKGYRGYYMMKYETSQEQYVEFLNSLTLNQQKNRVANSNFTTMVTGDYVFGDLKTPNNRNGIAVFEIKDAVAPVKFGNNLNPDNEFFSLDDGQTLSCNYLSPADMLAYCDWAGLRPMSELEYEKASRRPYPQLPEKGEYAWNSNTGVNPIRAISDLNDAGTESEVPFDYRMNVNTGAKLNGPVRNGAFATATTNQVNSGATYWGVMEMSGNLWEMAYNTNTSGNVFKATDVNNSHGDGYIADAGTNIAATYWPNAVGAIALRGGSFASSESLLRTSDRTYANGSYFSAFTQRDSTVGFRAVRSILNTTGFGPGRIYCQNNLSRDTLCSGHTTLIQGEAAEQAIGKTTYSWYQSLDNGTNWSSIEGASGLSLSYKNNEPASTSAKTIMLRRKVVCAVGEETGAAVTLFIPAVYATPALEDDAAIAVVGQALTLTMPAGPSGAPYLWEHPDGTRTNAATLTISSFTMSKAGIYYASYSGGKCEALKKGVEVYPYEEISKQAYYYKGSEDVISSIPSGATHARAYLIGAAGGGGNYGTGSYSGAGGYTDVVFNLGGVSNIGVIVGQGGRSSAKNTRGVASYPNGGIGQGGDVSSGSGGGRSQVRIQSSNQLIAIAGGGGGATGYAGNAGAGGGTTGQNSGYATGGSQTGSGGTRPGSYLQGAHANTSTGDDCGGGGDGYYGGGTTTGDGKPAAGGSGYINRTYCIWGKTYTGNVQARPTNVPSSILGYTTGSYGMGVQSTGATGNNGMVVLQFLKRLTY